jgi:hypothetical protein
MAGNKKFSNVQQRYAVEECDANEVEQKYIVGLKKLIEIYFAIISSMVPPSGGGGGFYLLLIATTASIFAARLAGIIPAKMPTTIQIITAAISMGMEINTGKCNGPESIKVRM